jgi:putative phosphoesterase
VKHYFILQLLENGGKPMKYAIISDIHSNHIALAEVLESIETKGVDKIICLGDLVGYHTFPNEVISMIKNNEILTIMGNHDLKYLRSETAHDVVGKFMLDHISNENKEFLKNLPPEIMFTDEGLTVQCVHGSPYNISEYMYTGGDNTESIMLDLDAEVLLAGHTHFPLIEQFGNKWYINPGSVGKPKIGSVEATYAILTLEDHHVDAEIIHVPYDASPIVEDLIRHHFPDSIIESAKTGKA